MVITNRKVYMKSGKSYLLSIIFIICSIFTANALTASESFEKAKAKITSAKTIQSDFNLKYKGSLISGKILVKGKKFAISSNLSSNWYNGTDLYTYNPSAGETTIFNPTASELSEINPLLYLSSSSNFKIAASKNKKKGIETVVLIPQKTGTGVKSVTIDLDEKTFLPKSIKIVDASGDISEITLSNLSLNSSISDKSFDYPKSKYPRVPINDMR